MDPQPHSAGSLEARAAILRDQVWKGELARPRLRLLAFLGHEAAAVALAEDRAPPPDDAAEWLAELERVEPRAAMRACLEAVRVVIEAWDRARRPVPGRADLDEATRAVADWLACPCAWHESEVSLLVCSGTVPPHRAWLAEPLLLAAYDVESRLQPLRTWELAAARLAELGTPDGLREQVCPRLVLLALAERMPPADPEAALLHARLWSGKHSLEQLRVAAALGHRPAAAALGLVPRERKQRTDPVLDGLAEVHCALQAGGTEAGRVVVRAAKIAAGMSENAPGIGARIIPEENGKAWLEAAAERVGWLAVLPKVRRALVGWAMESELPAS